MFKKLFKRLGRDEADRRAEAIREWAEQVPGTTLVAGVSSRSVARIAGVVEGIRMRSREGMPAIEAVITDGSGSVTAVWLGRRTIPGLALGCRLILEGRFGGEPGRLQVMNPTFEFTQDLRR
ncbi:MAG: OB-fold nucleic acid binding domain-containing protein [Actinomycetota bacterium]